MRNLLFVFSVACASAQSAAPTSPTKTADAVSSAVPAAAARKGSHEEITTEGTTYKNHAFLVTMPTGDNKPLAQPLETPAGMAQTWEVEHAGPRGTIRFSLLQFPPKTEYDVAKGYDASRDGVLKATKATLVSEKPEAFGAAQGRHVVGAGMMDKRKIRVDSWVVYIPETETYFELIGAFEEADKDGAAALKAVRDSLQIRSGWSLN